MKIVRGVLALLVLLGLVAGAPVLLAAAFRPPDLGRGWRILLMPDDGTLLTFAVVLAGWAAWLVFVVSLLAELAERVSHGRVRTPRGLRAPRAAAAFLVGAVAALATLRAVAGDDVPPPAHASVLYAPVPDAVPEAERPATAAEAVPPPAAETQAVDDAHLSYTVAPGDDLWTLSEQFLGSGARWSDLVAVNPGLDPRLDLRAGQILRLPADANPPGTSLAAGPRLPAAPLDRASGESRTVTVQRGDSLWSIAERSLGDGERWREIHELNLDQIADPDQIDIGWVLRLPGSAGTASPQPPAPERPAARPDSAQTPRTAQPTSDPPVGSAPATPAATTGSPDEVDTEDRATVIAGESAANPALLLLGGAGPLMAAGICAALAASRETQGWSRPRGRRFLQPGEDGARVRTALATVADPLRLTLLDAALRLVGEHCQVFGIDPPPLSRLGVTRDRIVLAFDGAPPAPPALFEAAADGWVLPASARADAGDPAGPHPYPALVTLGELDGETVLHDLLSTPVLGICGPTSAVDDVATAWVLELATAPWAPDLLLHVTPGLAGLLLPARDDVCSGTEDDLVDGLESLVAARREGLRHGLADVRPAAVFVFGGRLPAALRDRVLAARAHEAGVTVVLAHDTGPATWEVTGPEAALRGRLLPQGPAVSHAQRLAAQTQAAVAELRQVAESPRSTPAPWWPPEGEDPPPSTPSNRPLVVSRQEEAVPGSHRPLHPLLNLLGPIELLGTTGSPPARGQRTCMEYCAWLLEHQGSTAAAMTSSLLVAESSRRSSVSRLRSWLGKDDDGAAYLPDAYSGRIWLHPAVSSDWQQLQILIAPGVNRTPPETLHTALGMVRGAVLADAAPGQWSWAEELRMDIMATIRDIGLELTDHALNAGDIDRARWAIARALTVSPEDEELLCARIRTERRAGNHREVERLALKTTAHARRLGVDLRTDTVRLLQEVMEGRIRARTILP
ncbi:LysM peptidoglycan-binding domain-containing protein [Propionicicella superfundia]|uniref:LysM peptidoglycan-binding domain-containing protein n=1 Tax=Propionicicella superfundia TaxID=348582 RepID=UPI0003FBDFB5|nr:LysM peptidoglycan-binding domain-containing protein [Propionicicella superfundia]